MTVHFPDISAYQAGISLKGAPAAAIKATEASGWRSGDFLPAVGRARAAGTFAFAYHFLHAGNAAGQAAWCNANDGGLPLMLDWEPAGSSRPGPGDAAGFIDAYRRGGGVCNLLYLPNWYWKQIGSPSLAPFASRKMALVSSNYTAAYSDSGPGWASYGGLTPAVWQYTDKKPFNGQPVDFNAFRGTLDQLKALVCGGTPPPAGDPTIARGDTGPAVAKAQGRLNAHGAARPPLETDGDFGQKTHDAARQFQKDRHLEVDGVIGPATWAGLNAKPGGPPAASSGSGDARPYHGLWVTAGMSSLAELAGNLGYPANTLIRMTAVHFGTLGNELGGWLADVFAGKIPPTAKVPKGAAIWCD